MSGVFINVGSLSRRGRNGSLSRTLTPAQLSISVSLLASANFNDTANDYRVHTFSNLDTSGHAEGDDVIITYTLRNSTASATPQSIVINGVSATAVAGASSLGPNLFLTHSTIWRIPTATSLGATSSVVVTLPVGQGMNGGAIGLFRARGVASVTGFGVNPVLSSITNTNTLNVPVVSNGAVIAVGGERNGPADSSAITWSGITEWYDRTMIASNNRRAAGGFADNLVANNSYPITMTTPSAAGVSLAVVSLSPI